MSIVITESPPPLASAAASSNALYSLKLTHTNSTIIELLTNQISVDENDLVNTEWKKYVEEKNLVPTMHTYDFHVNRYNETIWNLLCE